MGGNRPDLSLRALDAGEELIDLSWATGRPDPRLRRLFIEGENCFTLAETVSDPQAQRILAAIGEALWALADEGVHVAPEPYRLYPALDAFFLAVRSGRLPWGVVRRLVKALRFTSRHLHRVESHAASECGPLRNAERALKHAARVMRRMKALEVRRARRPGAVSPLRLLVASLSVAPVGPPLRFQI